MRPQNPPELERLVPGLEDCPDRPELGLDPEKVEEQIAPSGDWIHVRLDEPFTHSRGGIAVPDASIPEPRMGRIIAQGPGLLLEDGKTRMPMAAKVGQRILFERAGGANVPRCHDTHKLIRNGSILAVIRDKEGEDQPRWGDVTPERLDLRQDWILVHPDRPLTQSSGFSRQVRRAAARAVAKARSTGKLHLLGSTKEAEREDVWTGTVVAVAAKGHGLTHVTRCLDGDRCDYVAPGVAKGDRVFFDGRLWQTVPGLDFHLILRERLSVVAKVGALEWAV
jgi:chaperonin GroES